jgi:phosphate uptake regulator
MYKRKIQIIAGSTYSISLPKKWILKNKLKEKNELIISEKDDNKLVISSSVNEKNINSLSLNIEHYENIDRILYSCYYLGIENIDINSKKSFSKEERAKIKKAINHMIGIEITAEDNNKIIITSLLDKTKIDLKQLLNRMNLLISLTIDNLLENFDINDININETEIDRLYHLAVKIISLSLNDSNVLTSSNIKNLSLIPSYFLMCKKIENIGDNISHLALHLKKNKIAPKEYQEILKLIKSEINRSIKHVANDFPNIFVKIAEKKRAEKKKPIIVLKIKLIQIT